MKRSDLLATCALPLALCLATAAVAQDLQIPQTPLPPPTEAQAGDDQVQFSAGELEYVIDDETVIASGDVRMYRSGDRLRADKVVWNRKTGKVVATGNIVVVNPGGDTAYGDSIELTDSLKDGVVDNMLVVLGRGGRLAARRGTRALDETVTLDDAAYTPCTVTTSDGCPKEPSWKITAVKVTYRPDKNRIYYKGAQINLFGLPTVPLPNFSHPAGGESDTGLLSPSLRYNGVNGFEFAQPYFFDIAPNRQLTITPHIFSSVVPMLQADYNALGQKGAFHLGGYATVSRRSDDLLNSDPTSTEQAFRGYIDGVARYQLDPKWSITGSLRLTTDRTFLRRYDISNDDRLRTTAKVERIDTNSYFAITGWYVQTLRVNDRQGLQPIALPEIDYRRRFDDGLLGGKFELQLNSLAITRTEGQDTQRAFASARWDLRKLTPWGQEVTFTGYVRGDVYNADDTLATTVASYRGKGGFQTRAIGALAIDVKWPFIGSFLNGTQRLTPRFLVGTLIALAGIALLLVNEANEAPPSGRVGLGVALTALAILSASTANVLQASEMARRRPLLALLAWSMLWGSLAGAALAWILAGPPVIPHSARYWGGVGYLAIIGSVVTFPLYFRLIRDLGPGRAAYNGVLVPVVAMGISTALEGYVWSTLAVSGGVLAMAGLVVALRGRNAPVASRL